MPAHARHEREKTRGSVVATWRRHPEVVVVVVVRRERAGRRKHDEKEDDEGVRKEVEAGRYKRVSTRRLVCFNTLTGRLGGSIGHAQRSSSIVGRKEGRKEESKEDRKDHLDGHGSLSRGRTYREDVERGARETESEVSRQRIPNPAPGH